MSNLICIDTNILIRFLRVDHPRLSPKARDIFLKAQKGEIKIYLDEIVVAESVWLLSSFYKLKKGDISFQLQELISQEWIINPRKRIILDSLSLYSVSNIHYIDCWIACLSRSLSSKLQTFDKKLEKSVS